MLKERPKAKGTVGENHQGEIMLHQTSQPKMPDANVPTNKNMAKITTTFQGNKEPLSSARKLKKS